ncbi:hypothetical protein [Kribbella sp. VKM Ac-2566]|uniref:hypothetical protein n=1 Tax=Kribbella sp. VKM Ac-2566 TaxID=2512218 RepID=UPI001063339A|nr:hypothetical protein [Kribbella sp. VKM Ac-2566]
MSVIVLALAVVGLAIWLIIGIDSRVLRLLTLVIASVMAAGIAVLVPSGWRARLKLSVGAFLATAALLAIFAGDGKDSELPNPSPPKAEAPTSPTPSSSAQTREPTAALSGRPTPVASTAPATRTLGDACLDLKTAARNEADALQAFQSSVPIDGGKHVTGRGPGFEAAYQTAKTAVNTASDRFADFLNLGGSLPKDWTFEGDLGELSNADLDRLHSGALAGGNELADAAHNQMTTYVSEARKVQRMKCPR